MATPSGTIREALARYYQENELEEPSTNRRWATVRIGPITTAVPNTRARVRALRLHDLHHLATGYDTSLRGEAEQSAWELAAGCHHHWFAWGINIVGALMGLALCPRRTARAFAWGRRCRTFYDGEFHPGLLEGTMTSLRAQLLDRK